MTNHNVQQDNLRGEPAITHEHVRNNETHGELVEVEKAIAAAKHKHNGFLKALGLSPLP